MDGVLFLWEKEGNMPFKSVKQRKYLFAKKPKLAKRWAKKYGTKIKKPKKKRR